MTACDSRETDIVIFVDQKAENQLQRRPHGGKLGAVCRGGYKTLSVIVAICAICEYKTQPSSHRLTRISGVRVCCC